MEFPAPEGFPRVIRLPLGVTEGEPPPGLPGISSTPIPDWIAENIDPAGVTDPREVVRLVRRTLKRIGELGGLLNPF